jgi:hypothetical protein
VYGSVMLQLCPLNRSRPDHVGAFKKTFDVPLAS